MTKPLTPEELKKEGLAAYNNKQYIVAAHAFSAAATGFQARGDALSAAEMLNNCSVAYLQAGDTQSAMLATQGTDQVFAAAGDTRRQALALGNLAAVLDAQKRYEEALRAYEESANLLKQSGDTQSLATVLQAKSALQLKMGRHIEALATMQAGLETIEKPNLQQRMAKKVLQNPFRLTS